MVVPYYAYYWGRSLTKSGATKTRWNRYKRGGKWGRKEISTYFQSHDDNFTITAWMTPSSLLEVQFRMLGSYNLFGCFIRILTKVDWPSLKKLPNYLLHTIFIFQTVKHFDRARLYFFYPQSRYFISDEMFSCCLVKTQPCIKLKLEILFNETLDWLSAIPGPVFHENVLHHIWTRSRKRLKLWYTLWTRIKKDPVHFKKWD